MIEKIREAILRAKASGVRIGARVFGVVPENGVYVRNLNRDCVCAIGAVLLGQSAVTRPSIDAADLLGVTDEDVWDVAFAFDGHAPDSSKGSQAGAALRKEFLSCE